MEDIKFMMNNQTRAIYSHYVSLKDRSIADLETYLNRPVGVGGHNTITEEIILSLESLEKANSMIYLLDKMIVSPNVKSEN